MKNILILLFVIVISGVKCSSNLETENNAKAITIKSATIKKELDNTGTQDKVNEPKELNNSKLMKEQNVVTNNEATLDKIDLIKSSESHSKTYQRVVHTNNSNIDDYRTAFYGFIGLSLAALVFFACKSYRLRLSRAERKYGVHGNRAAQELTPLPLALEDGNSDDEGQTIFDISRQRIVL